jgi:hypothetical protein
MHAALRQLVIAAAATKKMLCIFETLIDQERFGTIKQR